MQYLLNNGWTPCIEFESAEKAYCDSHGWTALTTASTRVTTQRYWVMGSSPCTAAPTPRRSSRGPRVHLPFPECFIRVAGFDNIKQVQCSSFLAHRPTNDRTFAPVNGRQAGDSPSRAAAAAAGKLLSLLSSTLNDFTLHTAPARSQRAAFA